MGSVVGDDDLRGAVAGVPMAVPGEVFDPVDAAVALAKPLGA